MNIRVLSPEEQKNILTDIVTFLDRRQLEHSVKDGKVIITIPKFGKKIMCYNNEEHSVTPLQKAMVKAWGWKQWSCDKCQHKWDVEKKGQDEK